MKRKYMKRIKGVEDLSYGMLVQFRGVHTQGIVDISEGVLELLGTSVKLHIDNIKKYDGFNFVGEIDSFLNNELKRDIRVRMVDGRKTRLSDSISQRDLDIIRVYYFDYAAEEEIYVWERDLKNERFEVSVDEAFSMIAEKLHVPADKIVLAK